MAKLWTDIHAHLIPGVDDGPQTVANALSLLSAHRQAGTEQLFATPHFCNPHFTAGYAEIQAGVDALMRAEQQEQQSIRQTEHKLSVTDGFPQWLPGAEVRLSSQLTEHLLSNHIPTLGQTRYVLVEFPTGEMNSSQFDLLYEITVRGYHPVVAHPERNLVLQHHPELLKEFLEYHVVLQITAQVLAATTQNPGDLKNSRLAWRIMETAPAVVVATDAHDLERRPPGLRFAYEQVDRRLGTDAVNRLVENASAIWENAPITELSPLGSTRLSHRGLWSRVLSWR